MKIPKSIQTKQTIRLFNGKYKYKIVLLSVAASWFRGNDLDNVRKNLAKSTCSKEVWIKKMSNSDLSYASDIAETLSLMSDFTVRVESPYINIYTNTEKDVEKLLKINEANVKYITLPAPGSEKLLDEKKVLVKNLDYSYKVIMGKTNVNHSDFVNWCKDKTDKIRLTKNASRYLSKDSSWGGFYFYVRDEKTLTVVKMFLGEGINSVESVVKT